MIGSAQATSTIRWTKPHPSAVPQNLCRHTLCRNTELTARWFEQCQADPCVFRRVLRGKVVVIIVVYVDDLLVASESKCDKEQAMKDLRSCFPIKDLGEAKFYLGCHITRDRDAGTLKLDQHHYVRTVASKFNVEKTSTTPAAAGAKPLSKDDAPQTEVTADHANLGSII